MKDFIERIKKHAGQRLIAIVCIDSYNNFELKYFFDNYGLISLEEFRISKNRPIIKSVIELFPVASFYEREIFEGFGVKFKGHELKNLFLPDDFEEENPMRRYK